MEGKEIHFNLNGKATAYKTPADWTLLRLLREGLGLTGTKCSCAEGECGACTVIFDGEAVTSCLIMAADADGHRIETVESLEKNGELHPLQKAFIAKGAIQCGFCTPGMLMSAKALLDKIPHPTEEQIREAMYGNLCRCTGYEKIVEAVLLAASGAEYDIEDGEWNVKEWPDEKQNLDK